MPSLESLQSQADRLDLQEGVDYVITTYTNRTTNQKVEVLELTEAGQAKKQELTDSLFNEEAVEHYQIPLGPDFAIDDLREGDILEINGLLALSLIRRRTGGYVCTFTDNFSKLEQEKYRARVERVNTQAGTVRILFDHWPGEYSHFEYFLEKPNLTSVNEPVSIGPECVIDFHILQDGKPHEDFLKWFKNAVKRQLTGKH